MAYNKELAQRVREALAGEAGLVEKKMFGGVGYMLHGNMACGILNDSLIVRVGKDTYEEALNRPYAGLFDTTGRPMRGWVMVAAKGCQTEDSLRTWVAQGVAFAKTLRPK